MNQRRLLKSQITTAWHKCITKDYRAQRINSERSLQASFWSQLNSLLPKTRRMFIEPCVVIRTKEGVTRVFPDLVICSTKEVIGVIELKYQPRVKPIYKKDMTTLSSMAKNRKVISISNQRFLGQPADEKIYSLSKYILFVWAGVHAGIKLADKDNIPLYSIGYNGLRSCFMELHAETKTNSLPEIYSRNNFSS